MVWNSILINGRFNNKYRYYFIFKDKGGEYGINLRYPEGFEFDDAIKRFANEVNELGFELDLGKVQRPHYVDKTIRLYKHLYKHIVTKQGIWQNRIQLAAAHMHVT